MKFSKFSSILIRAHFQIDLDLPQTARPIRADWQKAINEGCSNALQNGPLASFPVHSVRVVLSEFIVSGGKINPALCEFLIIIGI